MPVKMKAVKAIKYGSSRLVVGEEFDARCNQGARLLAAIGHAVVCTALPVIRASAPILRGEITNPPADFAEMLNSEPNFEYTKHAEPAPELFVLADGGPTSTPDSPALDPVAEKPKRTYQRRDMTAKKD